MFNLNSNNMRLSLFFCVLSTLLIPTIAHAELGGSGNKAANDAAAQRAAKAEKAEKRKHQAEVKKTTEAKQEQPSEMPQLATEPKEQPAAK